MVVRVLENPQPPILLRMNRPSRIQARFGALLLWLGLLISLGLTFATTFAWGFAASDLRAQRAADVPDEALGALIQRVDTLAQASLWVALGAVPLGLLCIIAGLVIRGRANRRVARASQP